MLQPRQRIAEWIRKQNPHICCLQETHLRLKDTHRLKVKSWKKIFHANGKDKKAGVAVLISDKADFKTQAIVRDKGHYIIIKGITQEEIITLVNIYTPNENTVIIGAFNTSLTSMDRSSSRKSTRRQRP